MLEEKILNDYKEAMKARDSIRASTLSFLRAALANATIEKRNKPLDDNEVIVVIKRQIKQHQDSIEQFKKGNRQDLVDKETAELKILESYLPKQLSADEIKKIIEEIVTATGASSPKDMGKVMKEVMAKVGGSADGKLVSDLVKERLSPPKEEKPIIP
jgi:hypothetical protein